MAKIFEGLFRRVKKTRYVVRDRAANGTREPGYEVATSMVATENLVPRLTYKTPKMCVLRGDGV